VTAVPYRPEEQVLKRIEEQQRAEMRRALEKKVVEAKPASGGVAFKPEPASENEKLELATGDRTFSQKVEAEHTVKQRIAHGDKPSDPYAPEAIKPKAEQFIHDFGDKPGAAHVAKDARQGTILKRVGAAHHMDVGQELGPDEVKCFEDPFTPESTSKKNSVDIVTNNNVAIECKNVLGDRANPSSVSVWTRQAERRLEPNAEGKSYKGVAVVVPDGKLTGEVARSARRYEAQQPKVRICEKGQLQQVLTELRQVKTGG